MSFAAQRVFPMVKDPGNTFQTAQQITLSSTPRKFRNTIGGGDALDLYRFRLGKRSRVSAVLQNLQSNADLELLNGQGQMIGRSQQPRNREETLNRTLAAGLYFIRVVSKRQQQTAYQLRVVANPTNDSPNPGGRPNTVPQITTNTGVTLPKGATFNLSQNQLLTTDREQKPDQLVYSLTNLPTNGRLLLNGTVLKPGERFTQTDINTGKVTYKGFAVPQVIQTGLKGVRNVQISGSNLLWTQQEDNKFKLWFANADAPTVQPVQIWQGDNNPNARISGTDVVFEAQRTGETDTEIFLSKPSDRSKATWQERAVAITDNTLDDRNAKISGGNLIWETADPGDPATPSNRSDDKLVLNLFKDNQITELAQSTIPINLTRDSFAAQIDGAKIVWQPLGTTRSLAFYDIPTQQISSVGANDSLGNREPQISGNNIVWTRFSFPTTATLSPSLDTEVFLFRDNQVTNISNDPRNDIAPIISGSTVAWSNSGGSDGTNIFYYNGTNKTSVTSQLVSLAGMKLSGNRLVWSGSYQLGSDTDLYFYDGAQVRQLTNNKTDDSQFDLDGDRLAWVSGNGDNSTLYVSQLSNGEIALFEDAANPQDSFGLTVTDGAGGTTTTTVQVKFT